MLNISAFASNYIDKYTENRHSTRSFLYTWFRTLANSASSKKRARQADIHHSRNVGVRSMMRTCIKKVYYAIEAGDKTAAEAAYKVAGPVIDRVAGKGLIHANKAARHKSRMNKNIRSMA